MILFVVKTATKQERKNTRKGLMCLRNKEKSRKHDVCGIFFIWWRWGELNLLSKRYTDWKQDTRRHSVVIL